MIEILTNNIICTNNENTNDKHFESLARVDRIYNIRTQGPRPHGPIGPKGQWVPKASGSPRPKGPQGPMGSQGPMGPQGPMVPLAQQIHKESILYTKLKKT